MYNLNTKRAKVEKGGTIEWVSGSFGSHTSCLYPMSILQGEGARMEFTGKMCIRDRHQRVLAFLHPQAEIRPSQRVIQHAVGVLVHQRGQLLWAHDVGVQNQLVAPLHDLGNAYAGGGHADQRYICLLYTSRCV